MKRKHDRTGTRRERTWLGTFATNHVDAPKTLDERRIRVDHFDWLLKLETIHTEQFTIQLPAAAFQAARIAIDPIEFCEKRGLELPWVTVAEEVEQRSVALQGGFSAYNSGFALLVGDSGSTGDFWVSKDILVQRYLSLRGILKVAKFFATETEWRSLLHETGRALIPATRDFILRIAKTTPSQRSTAPQTYTAWLAYAHSIA